MGFITAQIGAFIGNMADNMVSSRVDPYGMPRGPGLLTMLGAAAGQFLFADPNEVSTAYDARRDSLFKSTESWVSNIPMLSGLMSDDPAKPGTKRLDPTKAVVAGAAAATGVALLHNILTPHPMYVGYGMGMNGMGMNGMGMGGFGMPAYAPFGHSAWNPFTVQAMFPTNSGYMNPFGFMF